jgi:hypothetical protein
MANESTPVFSGTWFVNDDEKIIYNSTGIPTAKAVLTVRVIATDAAESTAVSVLDNGTEFARFHRVAPPPFLLLREQKFL